VAAHLRALGYRASVRSRYAGEDFDVLLALHATKNASAIARHRRRHPERPLIVLLAGTDLYGPRGGLAPRARTALRLADRIVVLHPKAALDLPGQARPKTRVILQSATAPAGWPRRRSVFFDVAVVGHLRAVKDPFRTALAVRALPGLSRIRVRHVGAATESALAARARAESDRNARYRWLGERTPAQAKRLIARSRLLVVSSKSEGGANVVSEALASRVPVISSSHRAALGLFGRDYPGLYPVGDTTSLARLLRRAEADPPFYRRLRMRCRRLARLVTPARERAAWRRLLDELAITPAIPASRRRSGIARSRKAAPRSRDRSS
jgi:putative glycosyltransferase (TIGR04348 family)